MLLTFEQRGIRVKINVNMAVCGCRGTDGSHIVGVNGCASIHGDDSAPIDGSRSDPSEITSYDRDVVEFRTWLIIRFSCSSRW